MGMTLRKHIKRHLGKKATKRVYATMPWLGGVVALAAGIALRKRGGRDGLRDMPSSIGASRERSPHTTERENDLVGTR